MSPKDHGAYAVVNKQHPGKVLTFIPGISTPLSFHAFDWGSDGNQVAVFTDENDDGNWVITMGGHYMKDDGTSKPAMQLGLANMAPAGKENRWRIVECSSHEHYYHIHNEDTRYHLHASGTTLRLSSSKRDTDAFLWKFIRLPKDLNEAREDAKWHKVARYIFREGYKMIKFATEDQWVEIGPSGQQGYVDTFREMGRDKDVYP
ncbi:hypothetical protein BDV10DRAFT_188565 [Aspergillus recurvatus]